jgi:hypothetical protein
VASVRERTIPNELPQLAGEVSANFCEYRVSRGQRDGSLRPYSMFSRAVVSVEHKLKAVIRTKLQTFNYVRQVLYFCG